VSCHLPPTYIHQPATNAYGGQMFVSIAEYRIAGACDVAIPIYDVVFF
jgi:hypothetical protein